MLSFRKLLQFTGCAVLLLGWLLLPAAASAHARLLRSSPSAGASLSDSPRVISLKVSEAVGLDFSTIRLLDKARHEQQLGPVKFGAEGDTSIEAPVSDTLPPGTYAVVWRIVSAVDGHLTSGSFVFRVVGSNEKAGATPEAILAGSPGSGGVTPLEGSGESADAIRWALRTLMLVCITFCLGGAIFTILVAEPSTRDREGEGTILWRVAGWRMSRMGACAAAILVAGLSVDLLMQVASISQNNLAGALRRADLARLLLSTTRYGFAWAMKALAALALFFIYLAMWLKRRGDGAGLWEITVAAGSLFLLAESLSSHAAASQGDRVVGLRLPVVSDWLHLVTATTWIGGLIYLAAVLFPSFRDAGVVGEERRAFLGRSIPRFSRLALSSVFVLGISGTYNLALHTTDVGAVLASEYGQVILLKVGLFAGLVLLGAANLVLITPRLLARSGRTGPPGSPHVDGVRQLRRNVRIEVIAMALVLACAGGLTLLPPPSGATTSYVASANAAPSPLAGTPTNAPQRAPVTAATVVAGYSMVLTARPSEAGSTLEMVISRREAAQPSLEDVTKVFFVVAPQDLDTGGTVEPSHLRGAKASEGQTWASDGTAMALEGSYMVTAVVQRTSPTDLRAAFLVTIRTDGEVSARPIEYVDIRFTSDPDPPVVGTAQARLALSSAEGAPVTGATIFISASQATAKSGGTKVQALPVAGQDGAYSASVTLPTSGAWVLTFDIEREGQPPLNSTASIDVAASP